MSTFFRVAPFFALSALISGCGRPPVRPAPVVPAFVSPPSVVGNPSETLRQTEPVHRRALDAYATCWILHRDGGPDPEWAAVESAYLAVLDETIERLRLSPDALAARLASQDGAILLYASWDLIEACEVYQDAAIAADRRRP